jgi:hypothetical protein
LETGPPCLRVAMNVGAGAGARGVWTLEKWARRHEPGELRGIERTMCERRADCAAVRFKVALRFGGAAWCARARSFDGRAQANVRGVEVAGGGLEVRTALGCSWVLAAARGARAVNLMGLTNAGHTSER